MKPAFCSKVSYEGFEHLLLSLKVVFVVLLVSLTAIVPHFPDMKKAVDNFPKKHPGLFIAEILLLASSGGLAMFLIGLLKGLDWHHGGLFMVSLASFVVIGLLHVLQQYSGMYTYSYEKPTPKMEKTYLIIGAVGAVMLLLIGLAVFTSGACIGRLNENSHLAITLLSAFIFGVVFSVPYLYVSYNRDHREIKEAKSYVEMILTLIGFMLTYLFLHVAGFWESIYGV